MNNTFNEIKASFVELQKVLSNDYKNVSILIEKTYGKNFRYSKTGLTIKENMFSNSGCVIRLYSDDEKVPYEYSFNNFDNDYILSIPDIIKKNFKPLKNTNIKTINGSADTVKKLSFNKTTDYKINPTDCESTVIPEKLKELHDKGMNYSKKILDTIVIYQYLITNKLFISDDKDLEQHIMWSNAVFEPLSKDENSSMIHYYYNPASCIGGVEILDELDKDIDHALNSAIELLDSTHITPGTYDVICLNDVTGLIAHEAFGHGVEMDMFVKDRALAKDFIGKEVASPIVNMHDNATFNQCGMYFFDDEGNISKDNIIIENGILKNGINDLLTCNSLDVEPTGNGRRESYANKAYTRMTNTYFEAGTSTLDEMIASIDYGILLENASGGMEDPKNWGIQCMVNIGREIKNGKLTGKIFSPICISGYVPDLLKSISMVSDDLKLFGSGYCGKGYKEWVKVSDGGPAIKAKAKLS
ncbi:TldD protein [Lachnospiraceae bacterium RM5]|nr:TldD protein [Lachnospiraceae bacterium RM5]